MTASLVALIDSKRVFSGALNKYLDAGGKSVISLSHETIYLYIWSDKRCGGQLFQHLRRKGNVYQSRSKNKQAG